MKISVFTEKSILEFTEISILLRVDGNVGNVLQNLETLGETVRNTQSPNNACIRVINLIKYHSYDMYRNAITLL